MSIWASCDTELARETAALCHQELLRRTVDFCNPSTCILHRKNCEARNYNKDFGNGLSVCSDTSARVGTRCKAIRDIKTAGIISTNRI
jgi:hypothetical protein